MGAALAEAAHEWPDRVALIEGRLDGATGRVWTYAEFQNQSEHVARALLARFDPGDRIAVWAHNIPEWALLQFGAAMAGMVLVTVNPAYQQSELDYVLRQSGRAGVVHGRRTPRQSDAGHGPSRTGGLSGARGRCPVC